MDGYDDYKKLKDFALLVDKMFDAERIMFAGKDIVDKMEAAEIYLKLKKEVQTQINEILKPTTDEIPI